MDPVKLRYFLAVFDARHFARGAAQIGVSQPAMSKSIAGLERSLGVTLFERGRFGAQPTAFATLLAGHARLILAEGELARAELAGLRNADAGVLRIGASPSLAQTVLPAAIGRYRRRWPGIILSVDVGLSAGLFDQLLAGDLDCVVSAPSPGLAIDDALDQHFLFEERDILVAGAHHPLAGRERLDLAELRSFPWIVPRRSGRLEQIHRVFAAAGLPPPEAMVRSESADLARGLMLREPFVCLLGAGILAWELDTGVLRELSDPGFSVTRRAFLTSRRRSRMSPAARNFVGIVRGLGDDAGKAGMTD